MVDTVNDMADHDEANTGARPFVLLGAGFSKAISDAMPVMSQLAPKVLEILDLPPDTLDPFAGDLEQWLSYLSSDQPWLKDTENLANRSRFVAASEAVRDVIQSAEDEVVQQRCPSWLERLVVSWCATEATVVTFNYDLLIERAITELRLARFWPDIYRTPLVDRAASMVNGLSFGHNPPPGPVLGLIKLHGSTNWGFSGLNAAPGEVPCLMSSGLTWSRAEGKAVEPRFRSIYDDLHPMIVPPTGTKEAYYSSSSLRAQWRRAAEDLRNASSVTLIGYSFPATDLATRHLFATNVPNCDVVVVDRDGKVAGTVEKLLGGGRRVKPFDGPTALNEYVDSECGDLWRWGTDSEHRGWYEINGERVTAPETYETGGQELQDGFVIAGAKVTEHLRALNLNLSKPFDVYDGIAHWSGERLAYAARS